MLCTLYTSQAWLDSFARTQSNRKAIADRGWNPLTYNYLLHPEILATKFQENTTSTTAGSGSGQSQERGTSNQTESSDSGLAIAEKLNLTQGLASTLVGSILHVKMRYDARHGVNEEEILDQQAQTAREAMEKGKRVTAGRLAATGRTYGLGPNVLKRTVASKMREEEIECEKVRKEILRFRKLQAEVSEL